MSQNDYLMTDGQINECQSFHAATALQVTTETNMHSSNFGA